ncbi:MAG TPA: DUF433 domain-containing protein [Thermoanaerobaculia bacterium]|nr:DUF433 domain-containing protein [Thermoanaerobaculia bacterium]
MSLAVKTDPTPLRADEQGVVRVGGTRVTLEQVVGAFREGATAEEIALRFSSLDLADVYAAVAYYLNHREAVDRYVGEQAVLAEDQRQRHAQPLDAGALRERLQARRRQV